MADQASLNIWTLVLGPMTGALIGFGASWWTNRCADDRETKRLAHDAEMKELDRKMAVKRDIYLSAIGDFARFQIVIATLPDTPLEQLKSSFSGSDLAATYAKLEMISPIPLFRELKAVNEFVREVFPGLVLDRQEQQVMVEALSDASRPQGELVAAHDDYAKHLGGFRIHCMEQSTELRRRLVPLVREIRRELDLVVNMKDFEVMLTEDIANVNQVTRKHQVDTYRRFGSPEAKDNQTNKEA
jgi:hypothetical protein